MTDLAPHRDDIVHRYVVGKESLRTIGLHYRVDKRMVSEVLEEAGVERRASLQGEFGPCFESPRARPNDDAKHLSLMLAAIRRGETA